jgi:hypothetical protein
MDWIMTVWAGTFDRSISLYDNLVTRAFFSKL